MRMALLVALVVIAGLYVLVLAKSVRKSDDQASGWLPSLHQGIVGLVTNFFDTLGIGNFAPTTVWYRATKMVPDERIPGTMNVGHTLPVMLMGVLFIGEVEIESTTLLSMIVASVLGAWLGAGWVSGLSRKSVQVGMGVALLLAAFFLAYGLAQGNPVGADALELGGMKLILACLGIALLGALMTIGVGLYAPCMVLISLMGMNPIAAFPIMMGACAFLMPAASTRFLKEKACALRPSLGLTLGGIPGVLLAFYIVKSLDLDTLKMLVVVVVFFTALSMLYSASKSGESSEESQA